LTKSDPARHAVTTSVGVKAPPRTAISFLVANSMIRQIKSGTDQETRSGIDALPRYFPIHDGSCADEHIGYKGNPFDTGRVPFRSGQREARLQKMASAQRVSL
jgi:hypothetical protein